MNLADHADRVPLTTEQIIAVGAAIKKAGYRGPNKFMTAVTQHHIAAGWKWNEHLDQSAHRYNMATTRGLDPSRQSELLPLTRVADLRLENMTTEPPFPCQS